MDRVLFSLLVVMFLTSFNQTIPAVEQSSLKNVEKANQTLTKEERIFGLVTIYRTAKQHFAYFEQVPELDWDQAFKEHLSLVEKNRTFLNTTEYCNVLQLYLKTDIHRFICLRNLNVKWTICLLFWAMLRIIG